jgi:hypothetical protein
MAEAFALRAEYEGTQESLDEDGNPVQVDKFRGASLALETGETFDIAAQLADGDGTIVTEDPTLTELLRNHPALKTVGVPDGHPTVTPLASMSMSVLREQPEYQSVTGAGSMRKDEVVYRMTLARAGEDPNVELEQRDDGSYMVKVDTDGGDES